MDRCLEKLAWATVALTAVMMSPAALAATVNVALTAQQMNTTLPDGKTVPMWGYCKSATARPCTGPWAPGPTIVARPGDDLNIVLVNELKTPTSIVILGQIGGGIGSPVKVASPPHVAQSATSWPASTPATFTPPDQGPRARAFGPEAGPNNGTQTYKWSNLKPGTYLYETGSHPSLQAPMGLYGVLVVTNDPAGADVLTPGRAYPGAYANLSDLANVPYDASSVLLMSEIDPVQNAAVDKAMRAGADEYRLSTDPACSAASPCYPPAVNYNPQYFLINGRAFDRTNPTASAPGIPAAASSKNVLLRLLNAGLRSHTPTLAGLGMALVAEDGNVAPGKPKIQNEVLLTAGKTIDVLVQPPSTAAGYAPASFPIFDRQLSLTNANQPFGGMQGFLQVAGGASPQAITPKAVADNFTVPVKTGVYGGNVLLNDVAVANPQILTGPSHGTVVLNADGSFMYTPATGTVTNDSFSYYGNGDKTLSAIVTLQVGDSGTQGGAPLAQDDAYGANLGLAAGIAIGGNGVLGNDVDPSGYPVTARLSGSDDGLTVQLNPDGSFKASATAPGIYRFRYAAVNSQNRASPDATVTLTFGQANQLQFNIVDAKTRQAYWSAPDYRWTIEEDRTFHNPAQLTPTGGPANTDPNGIPNVLGTNFHASYMPLVATGCVGPVSCGSGQTVGGSSVAPKTPLTPDQAVLDPNKYYYISILPADAVIPDGKATGHTMGGALIRPEDIQAAQAGNGKVIDIGLPQAPLKPAQLSIFVFEDDSPTNGDVDGVEENKGLGGFAVTIMDTAGRIGDVAGQMTYDVYNMPLTNALFELDPEGCPRPRGSQNGPVGVIYTCPEFDDSRDPRHLNPLRLAGHALVRNINPDRYDVWVAPGADRTAKGETWYQVSTLEGTHANDAFAKSGEPGYFQEYGPPGFHAFVGFVNPDHVNARRNRRTPASQGGVCPTAKTCPNAVKGRITNLHMTRPWQTQLWDSGSNDVLSASTCLVSLNSQSGTGPSIGLARCDDQGNFQFDNVPDGDYQVAAFDDYLDQIIYYRNITVDSATNGASHVTDMQNFPVLSWFTNLQLHQFIDTNGNGMQDEGEPGIAHSPVTVRYRDGSISNVSVTDTSGDGSISELFPLFNWYVTESDTTRYTGTAVSTAVDGGGDVDKTGPYAGILSSTYPHGPNDPVKSTIETFPGDTYYLGIQGFISQTNIINWGKRSYKAGENGGITGMVLYAATRGLDDPRLHNQLNWEPGIPRVTVRLYEEITAPNGVKSLRFVQETKTSSWDDNLPTNCPGQRSDDPFVSFTLGSNNLTKCFDGMHNWNQTRPAYYDGRYRFVGIPAGRYVVEVVPPAGYEIVKEEDKNVLMGDAWVAPVTQQFAGFGNIFILPDQATVNAVALPEPLQSMPACVGELHTVPDYLSLFPVLQQVAPFAGESRPLCNRKYVVLNDQMQASADFQLFTEAPIAAHYTGMILDDLASEFNASSPDFGEKFAVPFVPVSIKDFNGIEINRVYADQWGMYNGLVPSTWAANVPNPSGYAPNMLINCMNDPGPITVNGKLVTDPNFNPRYSNFCYTNPFMPGGTTYLDTPVLPVSAFASGYNPPDCAYPDATPAVRRVDTADGFGPWIKKGTGTATVTIQALGDTTVLNPAYEGPSATAASANQSTIVRHYGFGALQGNGKVTLGGTQLTVTSWSDAQIQVQVPRTAATGELVVTAGNGKSSVDAVTLTIDTSVPTRVGAGGSIQNAIDAATPGDLILVDEGTYNELLIMWKPVRLQGVGAPAVIINAAKYPTEKLEKWRPRINDLFGLDRLGNQVKPGQVDPLPGQEITGGIVLLEPSVLSTSEGAGITVLGKNLGPTQCSKLRYPQADSNFNCAPSRIDGLSITGGDSGGGIYVNGWAHGLEIANNRVYGNSGTFTGGIRIGQPDLEDLIQPLFAGFGFNRSVKVHHNGITMNGTVEANAGVAGGGGGLSLCTGTDNYTVNYNFICGNFSLGDAGGVAHIGYSVGSGFNGSNQIANNTIIFNQSFNQSAQVSGGGLLIAGTPSPIGGSNLGAGAVTVDANLIEGNHAGSGHGGGVRMQFIGNGANVTLTNNMIVNNVAGYAGGGIALERAASARIINNTIAHNDSTATAQGAFPPAGWTRSAPQPAGIAVDRSSTGVTLTNNVVWENRSFSFTDDAASPSGFSLQPKVTECGGNNTGANYWDLGVVGLPQSAPTAMSPKYSVLTSLIGYDAPNLHNSTANPTFLQAYCNVARFVAPGIFDGTPGPQEPFTMMQAAGTLDEGGNWVEVRYGPLSLSGDYHINTLDLGLGSRLGAPNHDYDMATRPNNVPLDVGADQIHSTTQVVQGAVPAPVAAGQGK